MADTSTPQQVKIPEHVKLELDINEIIKVLPHRPPFVLVDRVTGVKDMKLHGYKMVTINEPWFMGHFPEQPVMPGVLQLEALGQLGAIFAVQAMGVKMGESAVFLLGLDNCRFRRMVIPGDRLDMEAWLIKKRGPIWRMGARGTVNGENAVECEVMAWIGSRDQAPKMG